VRLRVQVLRGPPSTKIFLEEDKFNFRVTEKNGEIWAIKIADKIQKRLIDEKN